jgi:uncharacterized protein (TIGR03083 family)
VTNDQRIAELERQGEALAEIAGGPALHLEVATCPGWSVAEVVRHVGGGHRWCISVVTGGEAPSSRPVGEPDVDERDLVSWFNDGLTELLGILRTTPAGTPTWTPVPAGTAEWWTRKMVVETAIHRWDIAAARDAGTGARPEGVPTSVATDGIDEYVDDFVRGLATRTPGRKPRGQIELQAVEGRSWSVSLGGTPGDSDTSTQIKGTASDLLLWLWNRLPDAVDQLEVSGDQSVVADWQLLRI